MGKFSYRLKAVLMCAVSVLFLTGCSYTINVSPVSSKGIQIGNDFVVIVSNKAKENKNVYITLDLLKGDKVIKTLNDQIINASSKADMAIVFENAIETNDYDNYKITLKAEKAVYNDQTEFLTIEEKKLNTTSRKDKNFKLSNDGYETIDVAEFVIIYYKDKKPIATSYKKAEVIKAGSSRNTTVPIPEIEGNMISYDNYDIYKSAYN